jgi:hypothetical protein
MHFKLIWGTSWRKPTMEHTSSLKNISPNKYVLEFIPEVLFYVLGTEEDTQAI